MGKFKIGLQLYSVRDEMEKDMDACLKKVKEMGYDCVEFAGFFGKTADEVKGILEKYDLEAISTHQTVGIKDDEPFSPEEAIKYLKAIGVKYCVIPWYGLYQLTEEWDDTKKKFEKSSAMLKKGGIELYYHNHDFEFEKVNGRIVHDMIFEELGLEVIKPEIDVCWAKYAGFEPVDVMKKYAGKINILHLKDFVCKKLASGPAYALIDNEGKEKKVESKEDNNFEFRPIGHGMQDIPKIIKAAEECGIEYLIVEQDLHKYKENPIPATMDDVKKSIDYLKTLNI